MHLLIYLCSRESARRDDTYAERRSSHKSGREERGTDLDADIKHDQRDKHDRSRRARRPEPDEGDPLRDDRRRHRNLREEAEGSPPSNRGSHRSQEQKTRSRKIGSSTGDGDGHINEEVEWTADRWEMN